MVGGVETLFGAGGKSLEEYAASVGQSVTEAQGQYDKLMAAQSAVMSNAQAAFNTAGVSANSYMEQATSMSASLIQGLGGDTQAAAAMVDMAIKDMSDNSNKMGTSIEQIQGTYQSLMRGNYAMLDNLKLGYGGTKAELERLVADASKLTGEALDPGNFADVIKAIHAVQDDMGITGTTAKEAATTIEGSVNTMKASWDNWLTALGRDDVDMDAMTGQLLESLSNVAKNVGPRIVQIGGSILENLPKALSGAAEVLAPVLSDALASAWNMAGSAIGGALGIELPTLSGGDILGGLGTALQAIQPIIASVGPALSSMIQSIGPPLMSFAQAVMPPLLSALSQVMPLLASIANAILPPLISFLTPIISAIMTIVSACLPPLISIIQALTPVISAIMGVGMSLLNTFSAGAFRPHLRPMRLSGQPRRRPLAGRGLPR